MTLTLTFDPAIRHIVLQQSSTSTYIPTFIQIEETFCGRTDGRTFFPSILLGRLSEVDLTIYRLHTYATIRLSRPSGSTHHVLAPRSSLATCVRKRYHGNDQLNVPVNSAPTFPRWRHQSFSAFATQQSSMPRLNGTILH